MTLKYMMENIPLIIALSVSACMCVSVRVNIQQYLTLYDEWQYNNEIPGTNPQ